MVELGPIIDQVSRNCYISDSRYAGIYSVCGLALRLRNLYKWDKGLDPWVEDDSDKVLEWIGDKEETWEKMAEEEFVDIMIADRTYDPFDAERINLVLEPHGLFYGAGYVYDLKPSFFLARIEETRKVNGHRIYILGRELARDLLIIPALTQANLIIIKKESARFFLWDQIFYVRKSGRPALEFALKHHGLEGKQPKTVQRHLERISEAEVETYIYHEIGEILDDTFDRDTWREVISAFHNTPIELLARSVKDLLADTNQYGRLQYVTREQKTASLAFYVAFLGGLTKDLFPEIMDAFQKFTMTNDWDIIQEAVTKGHDTAKRHAEEICRIFQKGKEMKNEKWAASEITRTLLAPLGV